MDNKGKFTPTQQKAFNNLQLALEICERSGLHVGQPECLLVSNTNLFDTEALEALFSQNDGTSDSVGTVETVPGTYLTSISKQEVPWSDIYSALCNDDENLLVSREKLEQIEKVRGQLQGVLELTEDSNVTFLIRLIDKRLREITHEHYQALGGGGLVRVVDVDEPRESANDQQ